MKITCELCGVFVDGVSSEKAMAWSNQHHAHCSKLSESERRKAQREA